MGATSCFFKNQTKLRHCEAPAILCVRNAELFVCVRLCVSFKATNAYTCFPHRISSKQCLKATAIVCVRVRDCLCVLALAHINQTKEISVLFSQAESD